MQLNKIKSRKRTDVYGIDEFGAKMVLNRVRSNISDKQKPRDSITDTPVYSKQTTVQPRRNTVKQDGGTLVATLNRQTTF